MDVCWSVLVLAHVEKLRIIPGFTEASPLDLYYMPYTHGLPGALALSAMFGGIVAWFYRERRAARVRGGGRGGVLALAARSGGARAGHAVVGEHHEGRLRPVALGLDQRAAGDRNACRRCADLCPHVPARRGGAWLWIFVTAMGAVEVYNLIAPPPAARGMALMALAAYGALAVLAGLVDRPRAHAPEEAESGKSV